MKLTEKLTSNTMSKHTKNTQAAPVLGAWIQSALSFGTKRKLIVAQELDQYFAILDFGDLTAQEIASDDNFRIGAAGKTPGEALAALDHALMEDAANDMVEAGVV